MLTTIHDQAFYGGQIKTRLLPPDLTEEEFKKWWPRLTEKERDRYTVYETHNLITTNGRNNFLNYVGAAVLATGSSLGAVVPFAQYFAVGTFPINSVSPGDTSVNSEVFRAVPSTSIITGNQVDISTFFGTSQGNYTYTNCGLFGNNATGTSGSGTLMTHALYTYTKTSANSLTNDYIITIN